MRNETLAAASDIGIWATMAVLALAMVSFTMYLAFSASADRPKSQEKQAVAAGRSGTGDTGSVTTIVAPPATSPEKGRRWGVIGLQLTLLATFLLVASVALRGLSVSRPPLGNMYEFALAAGTFALVIYSGWALKRDLLWLGLFVTAPTLLILGAARLAWHAEALQLLPSLNSVWLIIHVTVATLSVGVFTIGFATAALYLIKERAEDKSGVEGVTGWLSRLPKSAALERLTYGIHIVGFPLWSFTLIAGAIWAEQAWGRYWGWDAKEVWTFVIWAVYAAYLHARATAGVTRRKATYIALAGFACIIINYTVVNLVFVGLHSYSGV